MSKETKPAVAGQDAASEVQAGPASAALPRFKVTLNCPTPLTHKTLVVASATAEEARQAFMAANGISGSGCEWIIEPTTEPVTELKK